jgi:beta-aspartyl-peptidase (threonine type)
VDGACAAVRLLEDDPVFNAGTGSSLTRAGTVECDAAVMDGASVRIGGVASMSGTGEAISIARAVLEDAEHALLCGEGAWAFARERAFRPVDPATLITEQARRRMEAARARRASGTVERLGGTVGASAIDSRGHVAAATSTGGTPYKRPGRIGDTPLCGCGTYADDAAGAASATGVGESIIRVTMTRFCADIMRRGASAADAAWAAVDELARVTADQAGIICCDRQGRLGAALSTPTMSFGAGRLVSGQPRIASGVTLERGADLEALLAG